MKFSFREVSFRAIDRDILQEGNNSFLLHLVFFNLPTAFLPQFMFFSPSALSFSLRFLLLVHSLCFTPSLPSLYIQYISPFCGSLSFLPICSSLSLSPAQFVLHYLASSCFILFLSSIHSPSLCFTISGRFRPKYEGQSGSTGAVHLISSGGLGENTRGHWQGGGILDASPMYCKD